MPVMVEKQHTVEFNYDIINERALVAGDEREVANSGD